MEYYYLTQENNEVGPIDEDILIQRARSGEIESETEVRNTMVKTYKPAHKIAILKEILSETTDSSERSHAKNLHRSDSSVKAPPTNYRFLASVMDLLVIAILVTTSYNIFKSVGSSILGDENAMSIFVALTPVIIMAYYSFSIGIKAQTFGFWFFGIMVIKGKGDEVFVGRAFFMSFFYLLTLPLAPFFIFIFTKGLHEAMTGTRVVNVKLG